MPRPPASPVRRLVKANSLAEQIYVELRARLQRCEIGPNERLIDVDIASAYGTSRMPAREALVRLANEGYLVGTTRGFAVPTLSLDDIRDIFEVRRLLEPRAAADAARDLDAGTEAKLAAALAQARAASAKDDVEGLILANIAFREAWLDRVRNRRLAVTIARFVDHAQTVRLGTLTDPVTRKVVADGLEGLYDAFRRRDPAAAEERMTDFMAAAEKAFFSVRQAEIAKARAEATPRRAADG
jgi:DNA-binding GntR family transcriptional regulator